MHLGTFTQPCAERSKSSVEQTEEITVESLLESNDIQPLGNKLRFLVAPRKRKYHESDALFFLTHPRCGGDSAACAATLCPPTLPILHSAKFDLFRRFNIEPILPTQNLLSRIRRSSESKSRKDSPSLKTTSFRLQLYLIANPTLCFTFALSL